MSHYSIKDLEQLSGIKAHTLRIWEQRYNFLKPKRTETNIRYYDDKDLKLILNVSLLNKHGFKISKIASMDEDAIHQQVRLVSEKHTQFSDQVQALTVSMIDLDEHRFEKTISTCILQFGFERAMTNIIYPFMEKVGILWQIGSVCPAHEHFITNLIRQKIIVAIDGQYSTVENLKKEKFMLYLPQGELHEISLLFASFIIKSRGFKVVYLGQSLPLNDLIEAHHVHKPDFLFTIITSIPDQEGIDIYLKKLSESFKNTTILLSGYQALQISSDLPSNMRRLKNGPDLISFLESKIV